MKITPETPINELKAYRKELCARWGPMSEALYQARPNQAAEVAYSDFESLVSAVDTLIASAVDAVVPPPQQPVIALESIHGNSTHTIRDLTEEELIRRRDEAQKAPEGPDNTPDGAPVISGDDSDSKFNADSLVAFLDDHGRSTLTAFRNEARTILVQLQGGGTATAKHNLVHLVEKVRPGVAAYRDADLKANIYHEAHRDRVARHPYRQALIAFADKIEEAQIYLSTGREKLAAQSLNTAKG